MSVAFDCSTGLTSLTLTSYLITYNGLNASAITGHNVPRYAFKIMVSNSISINTLVALSSKVDWKAALQSASSAEGHMVSKSYSGLSDKGGATKVSVKLPKKSDSPAEKLVLWLQHFEAMQKTWAVEMPIPSFVVENWPVKE